MESNKTNRNLLRVGTWINVADETKKVILKNKLKYEQMFYLKNYNVSLVSEFSELNNKLDRYPTFIRKKIADPDTRALLRNF